MLVFSLIWTQIIVSRKRSQTFRASPPPHLCSIASSSSSPYSPYSSSMLPLYTSSSPLAPPPPSSTCSPPSTAPHLHLPTDSLFQYQQIEEKLRIGRVGEISLLSGVFPSPSLRYTINYTVKDEYNVN